MRNEFDSYLTVISSIVELEQKFKVFWYGGVYGFTKQASKVIKNNFKKCVHVVRYALSIFNITYLPYAITKALFF